MQTKEQFDWSPKLLSDALAKIDRLIESTNGLATVSAKLEISLTNFQLKWEDEKEDITRKRHEQKNEIIALKALYETVSARIDVLEEDKIKDIAGKEKVQIMQNNARSRYRVFYYILCGLGGFLAWFHIPFKRFFLWLGNTL